MYEQAKVSPSKQHCGHRLTGTAVRSVSMTDDVADLTLRCVTVAHLFEELRVRQEVELVHLHLPRQPPAQLCPAQTPAGWRLLSAVAAAALQRSPAPHNALPSACKPCARWPQHDLHIQRLPVPGGIGVAWGVMWQ